MRILHIIGTLDLRSGGPAQGVRSLMTYEHLGYEGEVATMDDPNAPFLKDLTFPVHAFGAGAGYGYSKELIPWLKQNRSRFDGVIVNGIWKYFNVAAQKALKGHTPYMVFTHGMLDPYFKRAYPLKHIKKAVYWYLYEYSVLRDAYRVLFTTSQERDLAEQTFALHRWTPAVVPYGTTKNPTPREECLASFFQAMPEMQGKRFLLFLSRIHAKKGCDLLIQAFQNVAATDPDLHLVVAGPDQEGLVPELQKTVQKAGLSERVHWPGMLSGNNKWGAMYASEAFILPSHQENFGIAVAEALACGRPVLISNQVNIAPEIAEDGCGYVAPDTLAGTQELMERWIATPPDVREKMGIQATQTSKARYDIEGTAHAVQKLFKEAHTTGF